MLIFINIRCMYVSNMKYFLINLNVIYSKEIMKILKSILSKIKELSNVFYFLNHIFYWWSTKESTLLVKNGSSSITQRSRRAKHSWLSKRKKSCCVALKGDGDAVCFRSLFDIIQICHLLCVVYKTCAHVYLS